MVEQIVIQQQPDPESPEYVAEMAAKGEAAVQAGSTHGEQGIPPKPEGVPDKFYNAATGEVDYAGLAKSYAELEKKLSQPKEQPKNEEAKPEAPKAEEQPAEQKAAEEAVKSAGLDFDSLSQEYAESGSLSEESYAKLEAGGIPRALVDQYIVGQQAAAEVAKAEAFSITEGADGYTAMIDWAKANLSSEEIQAYNYSVNAANKGVRDMAVRGLWARYTSENGTQPNKLLGGRSAVPPSGGAFQSIEQMRTAMADPRYKADPAYRKAVEERLARSNIF